MKSNKKEKTKEYIVVKVYDSQKKFTKQIINEFMSKNKVFKLHNVDFDSEGQIFTFER